MSDPETRVEYAQPILERHESAASEADIRSAVRDFLIQTGLAPESEIQQEEAPAPNAFTLGSPEQGLLL
jgi:Zn-dependent protease with chaperone function